MREGVIMRIATFASVLLGGCQLPVPQTYVDPDSKRCKQIKRISIGSIDDLIKG
jgi:hypothetical protein